MAIMDVLGDVLFPVASGLIVAATGTILGILWRKRRVPTALVRSVWRATYLGSVLRESLRVGVSELSVVAPRLSPAGQEKHVAEIQDSWDEINKRGRVRVLTLDSDNCLRAGSELVSRGIDVNVAERGLGAESLSYHIFSGQNGIEPTAIVNHHNKDRDQPARISGTSPVQVFGDHFEKEWRASNSLETVIAEKILNQAGEGGTPNVAQVVRSLQAARHNLGLSNGVVEKVLPHLAFRHSASVIFVVGLPGTGKSHLRKIIVEMLQRSRVRCRSLSDYPYAFQGFIHELLKLEGTTTGGFTPYPGGAFTVGSESVLTPALRALANVVRNTLNESEVTLVEFARSDLVRALYEFDDIRSRSQVLYVTAPAELRATRLRRRAEPPESRIDGGTLSLVLPDNHLLPSIAEQGLYGSDDSHQLARHLRWRGRVHQIDNSIDDGGQRAQGSLDRFVSQIVDQYRPTEVVGSRR
ncbi:hypothetical protein O7543_15365 [Solwaraspora sp. WMMA2080]|uniref:hypothetical protein n=1 Tax=unclassified Solwaraspora TaxID=2627926 RepID=UPI00248C3D23|nr:MULTISPECIES: hypothetical protein [unclassified Solwaraspora]WBB97768.1 hypothetical protein O7553_01980 [Solwaraspora sp. WMMA2059]WBC18342.1 hypothetical protein O7543_15365 [Solwaraspora sp. WMMA2080]